MSTFGEDLIQSLEEAVAHAQGNGPAILHTPVTPRAVRKQVNFTQAQMASLMGMSLSGYRKWEQGTRRVNGPAVSLLHVIAREPEAVKRALLSPGRGIGGCRSGSSQDVTRRSDALAPPGLGYAKNFMALTRSPESIEVPAIRLFRYI